MFVASKPSTVRLLAVLSLSVSPLALETAFAQAPQVELRTIDVQGQTDGASDTYVQTRTATGAKTETPIRDIPQSISVITRQNLDDRVVQKLNEAVNYTAGVQNTMFGYDPRYDSFWIRGFDATYTGMFRDGLREMSGNLSIYRDEPYGLEGITVLRGPSSTLYSQSAPGGIVDLRTKRPTATPLREIEMQIGSYNRYQGNFDLSGPSSVDPKLLYRLTGLYRESDTAQPFNKDDRVYIAPAFTYNFTPNTKLTLLSEYSESTYGGTAAYYSDGRNVFTNIPLGDPKYNDSVQKQGRIGYEFEHRISDAMKLRQNFRYSKIDVDYRYVGFGAIAGNTIPRTAGHYLEDVDSVVIDNQAEMKARTGPIAHTVVFGADYAFADWNRSSGDGGAAPPLDLTTLNYGANAIADPAITNFSGLRQNQFGVYGQEQAKFDNFTLTLGGRYDWLDRSYYSRAPGSDVSGSRDDEKFSGRVGLSYLTPMGIAPYVAYSTSFAPTLIVSAPLAGGRPFAPTTAQGKEVGIKYEPPGTRALLTMALFDITQQNTAIYVPASLDYRQIGETRSRGLEIDGSADFGRGFRGTIAYTYMDMEVVEGLPGEVGHMPSGIPRHQASAWGNYTVQDGALRGFSFGLGARYIGTSYGDNANTFDNPTAVIIDGTIGYDFGQMSPQLKGLDFKLNGTNLFGEQYATCKDGYCYYSEDRRVIGSLRYRW